MHNKELQRTSEMKSHFPHGLDMGLSQSSSCNICFHCCHCLRISVFFLSSSLVDYFCSFWFICNAFRHALPGIVIKFSINPCKLKKKFSGLDMEHTLARFPIPLLFSWKLALVKENISIYYMRKPILHSPERVDAPWAPCSRCSINFF